MTSTVVFPTTDSLNPRNSTSKSTITEMSVVSLHATAVEVCDFVYGDSQIPMSLDAIDRFYESSAIYENPVLTATSRSLIADIHKLARQLSHLDVPRPLAMFYTLFRLSSHKGNSTSGEEYLFQGMRVWSDLGEICESESFDGHRRVIVEHTLNVLFLPGIHSDRHHPAGPSSSLSLASHPSPHPSAPGLPIPGTLLSLPSPLHLQLHVITRLSFNEQGRITHHRDFWDVKDLMGLVPGMGLAQWIGGRLAARGLSLAAKVLTAWKHESHEFRRSGQRSEAQSVSSESDDDLESTGYKGAACSSEMTPAAAYGAYAKNALGLTGVSS